MSTSDVVRTYLKHKPYLLEALGGGIVNFSALARVVQRDLGIKNHYAVKAAIIRYSERLNRAKYGIEQKALPVLKGNKITLSDGMRVIVADKKLGIENIAEVKLDGYFIYLADKVHSAGLRKAGAGIIKLHENCSVITISSAENLEDVPGVMAFLASVFAEQEINLIELISCYTQTILVVNKEDALRSYELLSEITK